MTISLRASTANGNGKLGIGPIDRQARQRLAFLEMRTKELSRSVSRLESIGKPGELRIQERLRRTRGPAGAIQSIVRREEVKPFPSPTKIPNQKASRVVIMLDRNLGFLVGPTERREGYVPPGVRRHQYSRRFRIQVEPQEFGVRAGQWLSPMRQPIEPSSVVARIAHLLQFGFESVEPICGAIRG
jgi:hypothetical protein